MNWDLFTGFWLGVISVVVVEFTIVWIMGNDDDNHNHFQPT